MRAFCASVLVVLAAADSALAGAWTLGRGDAQSIFTAAYSYASDAYDDDGNTVAIRPIEKIEIRALAEYGVTDDVTVFAQPEWRSKSRGDESVEGFGRFDFGVRGRVWYDDFSVASVQGSIRVPGASDKLAPLNGGDTEWELDARALYGRSFTFLERHGFVDVQAGYRHRLGDPPDELRLDFTVGLEIVEATLSMVQSFNSLSVGSGGQPYRQTQEHKIAVSTVYRFKPPWSFQIGGISTAYGRNVVREQGVFAAVWAEF